MKMVIWVFLVSSCSVFLMKVDIKQVNEAKYCSISGYFCVQIVEEQGKCRWTKLAAAVKSNLAAFTIHLWIMRFNLNTTVCLEGTRKSRREPGSFFTFDLVYRNAGALSFTLKVFSGGFPLSSTFGP